MHICFSHGKESGPWGTKIQCLAAVARRAGWQITSLDYTAIRSPDARVQLLLDDGHRLVNVLPQIETLFAAFLARVVEN